VILYTFFKFFRHSLTMETGKMITNSPMDKLLNGGIERDAITNIYGPAGSGKTNIALAATIITSGEKKVIYMDTEGSFSLERFRQLGGNEVNPPADFGNPGQG